MTNRSALLSVAKETNKKNGATEFVAILKEPNVVTNFRAKELDKALKLAHEYAVSRGLTVIEMNSVVKAS